MSASPIVMILGVTNPGNPFEVLGLPVGPVTESDVIDALAERMRLVAGHPLSETPEGNEVRLAVHAAAAQLLDSAIRAALLERAGIVEAQSRAPRRPRAPETTLGPRAMMVIASEGGWNPRAMRRIALLAHAAGVSSSTVPRVVRDLAGESRPRRSDSSERDRRGTTPGRRTPVSTAETRAPVGATAAASAAAVLLLGLTWLTLQSVLEQDAAPTPSGRPAQVASEAEPLDTEVIDAMDTASETDAPIDRSTPPSLDEPDWSLALIGIRDAKEQADAGTVARVIDGIAETWPGRTWNDLRRLTTAFVDIVYLMEDEDASQLIAMMANQIRQRRPSVASFHAGLLNRLSVERSLSTTVDNAVVAAMVSTIGGRQRPTDGLFERGAARGLQYVALGWAASAPTPEQLQAWLACLDTIAQENSEIERRVVRDAVEVLLRADRDPLTDAASLRAVEALADRMDPVNDAEASGMILRLLADQSVSTRSASVLVNAIARQQAAVDAAVAVRLAPTASRSERSEARTLLAESWLQIGQPADGLDELSTAIARHLGTDVPSTPQGQIADAVASARLGVACQLTLWGASTEASTIVSALRGDLDRILAQRSNGPTSNSNAGDAWAVRYLEAKRNIPVRLSLLGEMVQRRGRLGMIASEIVVAEALNGSPARVRREAQNVVLVNADQPAVINAVLEQLPTVPRVRSVQEIVERVAGTSLPAINDADWPFVARRAVVDRLLETESGTREAQAIDQTADLLADEYARIATRGASMTEPLDESASRIIDDRFDEIQRIDLAGAVSADVDRIVRLRAGRVALAEGDATRFAASQVTAVELLALLVELESPHLRDQVREIVMGLASGRAGSRSVFDQIALTERTGVELWALRLGIQP